MTRTPAPIKADRDPGPPRRVERRMPRVLLVSHRLPVVVHAEAGADTPAILPAAGGLASALGTVHGRPDTLWFGYPGALDGLAEGPRRAVEDQLRERRLSPVDLPSQVVQGYYAGLANGVVWPLFHYLLDRVHLDARADWSGYEEANLRFADAVAAEARDDDLVWVHDYQLMLLPAELRRRGVRARIGFFLHIPFPATDVYRILPWRADVLEGLLGANHIGFHTSTYRRQFASTVARVLDVETEEERVLAGDRIGRTVSLGVHPISVDPTRFDAAVADPQVQQERAEIRREAGNRKLFLGVDRLDYTKGIVGRLRAIERLFESDPGLAEGIRVIQVVVPTREDTPAYVEFVHEVHELVGRINARFSSPTSVPIHMIHAAVPFERLVALYLAADVLLVTPLRDGMNLVAKEFVVCRPNLDGVLVLSEFAGAAVELPQAILVNPYDLGSIVDGMRAALAMEPDEQRLRMRRMNRAVRRHDVQTWCAEFLEALQAAEPPTEVERGEPWGPPGPADDPWPATQALLRARGKALLLLDYDGTLMPFTSDPEDCLPDPALLDLLTRLCHRPNTEVHLTSGRSRADLDRWLGSLPLVLHAEHGYSERAPGGNWHDLRPAEVAWLPEVAEVMRRLARSTHGARVEEKAASVAWHYRAVDPELATLRLQQLEERLAPIVARHGLQVLRGAKVVEVLPRGTHKGVILARLGDLDEVAVLALGDDRTDEDLFAALPARAVAVHVGPGASKARYRLQGPAEVRRFLAAVASLT